MKLALILGNKQGAVVKPRLQGIKDNLNIDCFDDIPSFIDMALKRNAIYDRILVLSTKVNTTTLRDLNNYWGATSKDTEVVMLSKTGVDEDKAKNFLDVFMTPVACVMLVASTPVSTIAEGVLRPVAELNNDYGIKDFLNMEIEDDVYTPEEPKPVEQSKVQQPVQQQIQQAQTQKKPEKKKGFFSSLFGSRKSQPQQQVQQQPEPQPVQQVVPQEPIQNTNYEDSVVNQQEQFIQPDYQDQSQYEQSENFEQNMNTEFADESAPQSYEDTPADIEDDFADFQADLSGEVISRVEDTVVSEESPCQTQQVDFQSTTENSQTNEPTQSSFGGKSFEPEFEENIPVKNDFEPEQVEIDDDFGSEDFDYGSEHEEVHYSVTNQSEIDEDVSDMGVALDEEQYRQQTEQPKVIKQVITKEVIRNVNTGNKFVALNGVRQGRLKKVVIVTGDRGSGITSTALNIARALSKNVDVLYFDCDINNHGLLNYIDL